MNSHVLYVVCSFNTMIEVASLGSPTPTNGAPPPVKLVADWLATPGDELEDVAPEVSVPLVAPPVVEVVPVVAVEPVVGELVLPKLVPGDEDPNALDPGDDEPNALDPGDEDPGDEEPNADCELDPVAPAPIPPDEANPAAEPNPGVSPVNGLPKNPFTVVFASPTWISRQSAFPVIGST
jgi:hypothetical protein